MGEKVYIYDTTLRDGSQAEGVNFSIEDKLRIIKKLDEFGIDYIECGWPGSNPKDTLLFAQLLDIIIVPVYCIKQGWERRAVSNAHPTILTL